METWQQFFENKDNDYSCLMAFLPDDISKDIQIWGKNNISDADLYVKEGFGREEETHVTVLYGLVTNNPEDVLEVIDDFGPLSFQLGEISIFNNDDYDVIKIDVEGDSLRKLNRKLKYNLPYVSTYKSYKPHCTIAYVLPGVGERYIGNKAFTDNSITVNELVFSDKKKNKTIIKL